MNAAQLLKNFDRIAEAPGGIPDLRALIIHLAITGKLVKHEEHGLSGEDFYLKIQDGITRIASSCNRCRWTASNQIASKEVPYQIPNHWTWARINDTGFYINGIAFKPTDWKNAGLPIIRIQNLSDETKGFNYVEGSFADENMIQNGDLLVSWSATLDAFLWHRGDGVLNQHIFKVVVNENAVARNYLYWLLKHEIKFLAASDHAHGLAMKHINRGPFLAHFVPLPPLAEQYRIVAKVDELMALCDQLQAAQNEREMRRDQLVTSSLRQIQNPDVLTPVFLDYLPCLTTRPEHIKQLRQTILYLAVRGHLVPQDRNDEAASELLGRIRGVGLESSRSMSREADTQNIPFSCPVGWGWTTVQKLLDPHREISYGVIKLGDEPKTGGVPTLRCSDVKPGFIDLSSVRKVSETIESEYARTRLSGGEILINIRGTLGGVAKVSDALRGFNVAREVAVIPISSELVADFMVYVMLSPFFWDAIQNNLRGIAYKGLNLGILRDFLVPIPPIAEQRRIVAKVDELMNLCDQLEAQLTTTQADNRRLLEAVLREALPA